MPGTEVVRQNKASTPAFPKNLRRAVCAEYLRDFDLDRVSEMFDTDVSVIRRIVNSKAMQEHMDSSLGDISDLDAMAARRLIEVLLEEAFGPEPSKERTEARKMLARHYLPKRTESKSEVRYFIEIPAKQTEDEWTRQYGQLPPGEPEVLDAEVVDDEDDDE